MVAVCWLMGCARMAAEVGEIGQDSQGRFVIDSEAKLELFAQNVRNGDSYRGKTLILTQDIVMGTVEYPETNHAPIGVYDALESNRRPFCGTFDGQGHEIRNLLVNSSYHAGLFGYVGTEGVVKNLSLGGVEVRVDKESGDESACWVGAVAAINEGTIVGCANRGVTVYGNVSYAYVGGIVGVNVGSILNCYSLGRVFTTSNAGNYLGGIAGENAPSGTIRNCFVRASIDEGNRATDNPICANNQAAMASIAGCFYMGGASTDIDVTLTLSDGSANPLSDHRGQTMNVLLQDRILCSDGAWNTFCVPFSIPAGAAGESPIAGATVKELDGEKSCFDPSTGVLTLHFVDAATIRAGTPYIVKWDEVIDGNLPNPVFLGVTVEDLSASECAVTTNDGMVTFQGIFDAFPIAGKDENILYLGDANNLYYPNEAMTIGSCRAYFKLNGTSYARYRILIFDDSEPTSIHDVPFTSHDGMDAWFSLDGRRLSGKPTRHGVYINQGRKVVVK